MPSSSSRRRRTLKKTSHKVPPNQESLVHCFLEMLNTIKLYHWHTHSYPEHKATDELYGQLNDHIDKFVEVMLGKDGSRLGNLPRKSFVVHDPQDTQGIKKRVEEFKQILFRFPFVTPEDGDLANIRDEIVADLNQFLYLLTFR
jgi:DNA-binding ferritin-like protein